MHGSRARSALAGSTFADVRWVDQTGSTNDDVLAIARNGGPEGVVVVAEHQTAGRGRLDRSWQAPAGSSLLVSILVRPSLPPEDAHLVSTAVAVAAAEACADVAGVAPVIKWPNDMLLGDDDGTVRGKVAGILAETVIERGELQAVVVGIGLNVNWPRELPAELQGIATALNHAAGVEVDREDLLIALLRGVARWRHRLDSDEGRHELVDRYRELCATIGARVRVDLREESFVGTALDVSAEGHLHVQPDGETGAREVVAGDVVHVRDA
jgi:BirA family biotin operon repressor/biotin-[acetyl-CoA-carboxylase] ligase